MTVREVLSEVSALGYDGELECDEAFLSALERSKRRLFAERGVSATVVIPPYAVPPLSCIPLYRHPSGERAIFPLSGVSYSFYVSGIGSYTVLDGSSRTTREFNTVRERCAGYLSEDGSIIFEGRYAFTVTDLVCYGSAFGDSISDIPDGTAVRRLDLRTLVPDFHSFATPAKDSFGRVIQGVRLEEVYALIPSDITEDVYVTYYRTPKKSYLEMPDAEVDLPAGCEHLLALLVASYVYVDSYPDKAQLYGEMYREASSEEKNRRVRISDTVYRDTNGWA